MSITIPGLDKFLALLKANESLNNGAQLHVMPPHLRAYYPPNFNTEIKNCIKGLKRGDILATDDGGYYGYGQGYSEAFIWDDGKALPLGNEHDDYGEVPQNFLVTNNDFHPYWWMKIFGRTYRIFWLSSEIKKRLNFVKGLDEQEEEIIYSHIKIGLIEYICIVDYPPDITISLEDLPLHSDTFFSALPSEYDIDEDLGKHYCTKFGKPAFFIFNHKNYSNCGLLI